jgi:hypothetical protein
MNDGRDGNQVIQTLVRALAGCRARRLSCVPAALFLGLLWTQGAHAQVKLNEMTIGPANASESIELYNESGGTIDLGGWSISGSKGTFIIPPATPIPPGGYAVLSVGDIQEERGGVTSLIDLLGSPRSIQDAVAYGQDGSAPVPPDGMSLARAPDASSGPTPPPDPNQDGLVWTIDFTPTFGRANDAPVPQMGQPFLINEFDPGLIGGQDPIEFYNPSPLPMNANGWRLTNGPAFMFINGTIPPGGFLVVTTPPSFDLGAFGLLYLFRSDLTRVDQIGFHDAPPLGHGECYARCPDGAGPYLGYNYATSGGGLSFFPRLCTLGGANGGNCEVSGVADPPGPELRRKTWGAIKSTYAR